MNLPSPTRFQWGLLVLAAVAALTVAAFVASLVAQAVTTP